MKKLLNTLFVRTQGAYLSKEEELYEWIKRQISQRGSQSFSMPYEMILFSAAFNCFAVEGRKLAFP